MRVLTVKFLITYSYFVGHDMTLRSLICKCACISVSVGYEYESCPGLIQWERRTALMHGFELVPSNLGGWSLDKNHALNIRSGEEWLIFFFVFGCFFRK